MRRRSLLIGSLAALAAGTARGQTPLEAEIAIAMPLSGPLAALGQDAVRGAQLAIDEAHARGVRVGARPLRLSLSEYDDGADIERGMLAARWIALSPAVAVIGHLNSGISIPTSDVYRQARLAQVTPASTNPTLTERGLDTVFRLPPNDALSARRLGQYAAQRLRLRRVLAVLDDSFYAKVVVENIAAGLLAGQGQLLDAIEVDEDAPQWGPLMDAVRRERPDAIILGGMDTLALPLMAELTSAGLKVPVLGGDGICTDDVLAASEQARSPVLCYEPAAEPPASFNDRFRARFGRDPDHYAAAGFDAANVIIAALERAPNVAREAVLAAVRATDLAGLTYRIRFDARGDAPDSPTRVFRVQRGRRSLETRLP